MTSPATNNRCFVFKIDISMPLDWHWKSLSILIVLLKDIDLSIVLVVSIFFGEQMRSNLLIVWHKSARLDECLKKIVICSIFIFILKRHFTLLFPDNFSIDFIELERERYASLLSCHFSDQILSMVRLKYNCNVKIDILKTQNNVLYLHDMKKNHVPFRCRPKYLRFLSVFICASLYVCLVFVHFRSTKQKWLIDFSRLKFRNRVLKVSL